MKRLFCLFALLCLVSCRSDETRPKAVIGTQTGVSLQTAEFAELKGFADDNLSEVAPAFAKSCKIILENPKYLAQGALRIDAKSYQSICRRFFENQPQTDKAMRQFVQENFRPYRVLYNLNPQGRFTSYYEAEIKASKRKHDQYVYPVYGRPQDLIEVNLRDFDKTLPNRRLVMRIENQKGKPYYTRAEIEHSSVNAPVILWADDPVDIFLMQIQGSAVAALDDGSFVRVSYADNNGHTFVGIGSVLLKKGLLKPGQASMDQIRDWLKNNPQQAKINMAENPRFIFHRLSDADGPVGAMGATLTPGRSMAVDPAYIPLGSLLWLETSAPDGRSLNKMMAAQDIGGAIKGAVRGDYFWGHGEEALLSAGKMNSAGQYYILIPKSAEIKIND